MGMLGRILLAIFGDPASDAAAARARMSDLAAHNSEHLDWQHSIVDLMKLLGMDSSLIARQALARELGYPGDVNDTAPMNEWLIAQVMAKFA
jgi:hypothetical protein